MQFFGDTEVKRQASEAQWEAWCHASSGRPRLCAFAQRWVRLMEREDNQRQKLPKIAEPTMQQVRLEFFRWQEKNVPLDLYPYEIREVVLILRRVWACGKDLYAWADKRGGILTIRDPKHL